jgi:hypothetical protein
MTEWDLRWLFCCGAVTLPCWGPFAVVWAVLAVVVALLESLWTLVRWGCWLAAQATCGCCWRGVCGCVDEWALLEWAVRQDVPAAIHGVVARARSRGKPVTTTDALPMAFGRLARVLALPDADEYLLASNCTAVRRRVLPLVLRHPLLDAPEIAARLGLTCVLDIASPAAWDRMAAQGAVADLLTVRMQSGSGRATRPPSVSQAACIRAQDDGKPRVLVAALDQCQPAAVQWLLARPEISANVGGVAACVPLALRNTARHRTVASLACLRALVAFVQSAAAPGVMSCRPAVEALDSLLTTPSESPSESGGSVRNLLCASMERHMCCEEMQARRRGDVVCWCACRLHRSPCARAPAVAARESDTVVVRIGPAPSSALRATPLANLHPYDEQRPANMSAMVQEVRRHGEGRGAGAAVSPCASALPRGAREAHTARSVNGLRAHA